MLLQNFLENSARRHPDKVALICKDARLTYAEINRRADRVASLLRSHGIKRGDRVAIFLDNSVESVVSLFGILKADGVFLMLSPQLKAPKLEYILNNCGARAFISDVSRLNAAAGVRADPLVGRQPDRDVVVMNQRNGTGQYIRAEEQDGGAALCCARQQYRYVSGSAQGM